MEILPYLLVLFLVILNIGVNTKTSNNIVFFVLFLFGAMRYNVGYDFPSYMHVIEYMPNYERFEIFERWLVNFAHNSFAQLFFIVNSFITVYFVKWGLERISPNMAVSALIFLCFPLLYTHSFSVIRFWSAVAIIFYASTWLFSGKWYVSLGLMFLAIGFHLSAIIGLLFIPLYYLKINRLLNICILLIGFICGKLVLNQILGGSMVENDFSDSLEHYAKAANTGNSMTKIPYFYLIIDLFALLAWKNNKGDEENRNVYQKISTYFNVGVSMIFLFSFDSTLSSRLCRPFLLYIIVLVPYYLMRYKKDFVSYRLLLGSAIIISSVLLIYIITIYNESIGKSEYLPYEVFFSM